MNYPVRFAFCNHSCAHNNQVCSDACMLAQHQNTRNEVNAQQQFTALTLSPQPVLKQWHFSFHLWRRKALWAKCEWDASAVWHGNWELVLHNLVIFNTLHNLNWKCKKQLIYKFIWTDLQTSWNLQTIKFTAKTRALKWAPGCQLRFWWAAHINCNQSVCRCSNIEMWKTSWFWCLDAANNVLSNDNKVNNFHNHNWYLCQDALNRANERHAFSAASLMLLINHCNFLKVLLQ